jgi:hypothetical protein
MNVAQVKGIRLMSEVVVSRDAEWLVVRPRGGSFEIVMFGLDEDRAYEMSGQIASGIAVTRTTFERDIAAGAYPL